MTMPRRTFFCILGGLALSTILARARAATPLNVLIIGDSVAWGQGLDSNKNEKIHEILAQRWAPDFALEVTTKAHSGAVIGFDANLNPISQTPHGWDPEVPQPFASLADQFASAQGSMPRGGWDLVLICGGINDVGVTKIFDPLTSQATIRSLVTTYCYHALAKLVASVQQTCLAANPNTIIGVCSYYTMASKQTRFPSPLAVKESFENDVKPKGGLVPELARITSLPLQGKVLRNAQTFSQASHVAIASVVSEANANAPVDGAGHRIESVFLIDPKIDDAHAAMTKTPDLWGLDARAYPTDDVRVQREALCRSARKTGIDLYTCIRASVGHPNIQGAIAYANAIDATIGPVLRARLSVPPVSVPPNPVPPASPSSIPATSAPRGV